MVKDIKLFQKEIKKNIEELIQKGKFGQAELLLEDYSEINNNDLDIYSMKAVAFILQEKLDEAEKTLQKALEIDSEKFDIIYNYAYLCERKQKFNKALEYYKKALIYDNNIYKEEIESRIDYICKNNKIETKCVDKNKMKLKKILFVQSIPDIRTNKIAKILNNQGICTDILYLALHPKDIYKGFELPYENIYKITDINETLNFVNNSDYDVLFTCNEPDYLTVMLQLSNKTIIYDCHDMMSLRGDINNEQIILEHIANSKSDGNIYVTQLVKQTAQEKFKLKNKPIMLLDNYILKEQLPQNKCEKLSCLDGEIHCVYEGGLSNIDGHHRNIEKIFIELAKNKVHVHCYTVFDNDHYKNLAEKYKYIHFEGTKEPNELIREMTKYDIGLTVLNVNERNKKFLDTTFPNKAWEYLAAGLPILFSDLFSFRNFLNKHKVGEIINKDEDLLEQIKRIKEIDLPHDFLIKNKLCMDDFSQKLIDFICKVKEKKEKLNSVNQANIALMNKRKDFFETNKIKDINKAEILWSEKLGIEDYVEFNKLLALDELDAINNFLNKKHIDEKVSELMHAHYYMNIGQTQSAFDIYVKLCCEKEIFHESALANYYMSQLLMNVNELHLSQKMFLKSMELIDIYIGRESRLKKWQESFDTGINCSLCGSNNHSLVIERPDGQKVVKCLNCGLNFLEKIPLKDNLNDIYKIGYYKDSELYGYVYDYNNISREKIFLPRLDYINYKSMLKNKKMLDIGCANGEFLDYAKKYGWETYGIEISSEGYEICLNKGINISNYELKENKYGDNMFGCITMWDVIEHLINPLDELKEIHRILDKDGRLYISTPNLNKSKLEGKNWAGFNGSYEHLFFFDTETLKDMLLMAGFKIDECFSYELCDEYFYRKQDYNKNKNAHTLIISAYK
ncbi:methyltransferase domain-containing protein [Clostridium butyricum]|uniref:methyltransferase domain-containing protein n=1 Tax=Clostridium butyricum TaxID=1492 RepID=UPI001CA82EFB|nr:methyltransferase domain-containing protein [Clostridium butyricum]MBZ0312894.1 methyltransferase domain-containing protein [Clostridium butyricum]